MTKLPHSRLFYGPSKTVVISGPEIQVFDSQSGSVQCSTVNLDSTLREAILKSGPIRCAAVDSGLTHTVTVGDDKKMKVWETEGLRLLSERELPKKPSDIQFTKDGQTILTSDKFGDIFSYPLHPTPDAPSSSAEKPKFSSHDNPSGGKLILGHTSLLTTFLLTDDEKYIITADRDEHIRTSWYPQGYNIESYCLGHEAFVSALHIPAKAPSHLISGGGDPMLKVWDWYTGKFITNVNISEHVESYIRVKVPKGKKGRWDDEDGNGEDSGPKRGRRRKARGKGKGNEKEKTEEPEAGEQDDEDVQMREGSEALSGKEKSPPELETVLAVNKIASIGTSSTGEGPACVIFSATGATALFSCPYPNINSPNPEVDIIACDLDRPILDFVVIEDDNDEGALLWVLVDGEWKDSQADADETSVKMVRVVRCRNGEFNTADKAESPFLEALNSASVLPATLAQLSSLELYAGLSSLPKNTYAEHDPMDIPAETSSAVADDNINGGKQAAKLKTRRALAAAMSESKGSKAIDESEEREGKKPKTDADP